MPGTFPTVPLDRKTVTVPCPVRTRLGPPKDGEEKPPVKENGAVILNAPSLNSSGGITKVRLVKFKLRLLLMSVGKVTPFTITVPTISPPELSQPILAVVQPPGFCGLQNRKPKLPFAAVTLAVKFVPLTF